MFADARCFRGDSSFVPSARKTGAALTMRAMLLSDPAEADNKSELEVLAEDVTAATERLRARGTAIS
ncbi:hypothetical protein XH99_01955 [Bradyrhizobium nanningense]|uniref:SUF system FeS cluster assembly SufBD core domain-containing protein n=1 Tax=Bradyrhizobium nanningense TaxID=1325118 RepID=A0A4Q0SIF1_9BRAD|nr:SufD family Fe-S cluster assembly protein [Bradyrhizobium nanningense]RXH38049.1 hypothetical protein XH99_01955 [Bradyrhizobium nanningense]